MGDVERDGQLDHHTQKQQGREGSLACEFLQDYIKRKCFSESTAAI